MIPLDGTNRLANVLQARFTRLSAADTQLSAASLTSNLDLRTDDGMTLPQTEYSICRAISAETTLQPDDRLLICWLTGEAIVLGKFD